MVCARGTRKRVRRFSVGLGRFERRNTLLPRVALYAWCVYKWCFPNGGVLIEMKMMGFPLVLYARPWGTPYAHADHTLLAYLLANSERTLLILRETRRLRSKLSPVFEDVGRRKSEQLPRAHVQSMDDLGVSPSPS
jgi:hypothetical protein